MAKAEIATAIIISTKEKPLRRPVRFGPRIVAPGRAMRLEANRAGRF